MMVDVFQGAKSLVYLWHWIAEPKPLPDTPRSRRAEISEDQFNDWVHVSEEYERVQKEIRAVGGWDEFHEREGNTMTQEECDAEYAIQLRQIGTKPMTDEDWEAFERETAATSER